MVQEGEGRLMLSVFRSLNKALSSARWLSATQAKCLQVQTAHMNMQPNHCASHALLIMHLLFNMYSLRISSNICFHLIFVYILFFNKMYQTENTK